MEEEDLDELLLSVTRTKQQEEVARESDESARIYEGDEESSEGERGNELMVGSDDGDGDSDYGGDKKQSSTKKRKPSKRRREEDDEDEEWKDESAKEKSESEPAEFEDEYDSDLMGDEADRANLKNMREIDRERVIAERFEARQRKKEEWELRRRLKNKGKKLPTSKKDKARKKDLKAKTSKQLKKAALDRAAAERQKRKLGDKADAEIETGGLDDLSDRDYDTEKVAADGNPLRFEDIVNVDKRSASPFFARRDMLARWIKEAYFDRLVVGLFVRISVGENPKAPGIQVYRLCRVRRVVETAVSKRMRLGGQYTNKRLELAFGHLRKPFDMNLVSNHAPTETEFRRWEMQMDQDSLMLPSRSEVDKKLSQVKDILSGKDQPSEADMQKHRENYEKVNPETINRVEKRKELTMKIETARSRDDTDAINELTARLKLIEEVDEKIRKDQERKKAATTVMNTSTLLRMKAVKNIAKNEKADQIAAIRRNHGEMNDSEKAFLRLESAGKSYFSIGKYKSPRKSPAGVASDVAGVPGMDLSLDQEKGRFEGKGERRAPLSAKYDIGAVDMDVFERVWEDGSDVRRRFFAPALDSLVRIRAKTKGAAPRDVISFEEFQAQR